MQNSYKLSPAISRDRDRFFQILSLIEFEEILEEQEINAYKGITIKYLDRMFYTGVFYSFKEQNFILRINIYITYKWSYHFNLYIVKH